MIQSPTSYTKSLRIAYRAAIELKLPLHNYTGVNPISTLPLKIIDLTATTQLREQKESQEHIESLAFTYADTGHYNELPLVGRIAGQGMYVPIDGFHRLKAIAWLASDDYKALPDVPSIDHLDLENVEVRVADFETIGDAIVAAAGVNSSHGLKRRKGDIKSAIEAILKVDRMPFMENKFKLNKKAIMAAVNCSSRAFDQETKDMRSELEKTRTAAIIRMSNDGVTQRDIANSTGLNKSSVNRIINSVPNEHNAETGQQGQDGTVAEVDGSIPNERNIEVEQQDNDKSVDIIDQSDPAAHEPLNDDYLAIFKPLSFEHKKQVMMFIHNLAIEY